jgi:hypothetical protein
MKENRGICEICGGLGLPIGSSDGCFACGKSHNTCWKCWSIGNVFKLRKRKTDQEHYGWIRCPTREEFIGLVLRGEKSD